MVVGVGLCHDERGRPFVEVRTTGGDASWIQRTLAARFGVATRVLRVVPGATAQPLRAAVAPGDAIGHYACGCFGTVGCFLIGGQRRVLSNRHVLAHPRLGVRSVGDPVVSATGEMIGTVEFVAPFQNPATDVDVAVALVGGDVKLRAGASMTPGAASVGDLVRKRGAKTGETFGAVVSTHYSVAVAIEGVWRVFLGQLAITGLGGAFSDQGDSGSLVCSAVRRATPVGLLFAGDIVGPHDRRLTFANPFERVLAALPWQRLRP
jgi:hypothetical protein